MSKLNKRVFLILLLFVTFFCIDRGVGYIFGGQFQKITSGRYGKINYLIGDNDNDVLIFGNSRAEHHYVSNLLADSLSMSVYNFAGDGDGVIINCARISSAINKYIPKLIIIEVPLDFLAKETASVHISNLHPFYHRDRAIREILNRYDRTMPLKQLFLSYRYNSTVSTWLRLQQESLVRDSLNGYDPLFPVMDSDAVLESFSFTGKPADEEVYNLLYDTVKECKEKNIEVVFMISPYYYSIDAYRAGEALKPLYELGDDLDVPIFDNSQLDGVYDNPAYFKDKDHLNHAGAVIYMPVVLKQLRSAGYVPRNSAADAGC